MEFLNLDPRDCFLIVMLGPFLVLGVAYILVTYFKSPSEEPMLEEDLYVQFEKACDAFLANPTEKNLAAIRFYVQPGSSLTIGYLPALTVEVSSPTKNFTWPTDGGTIEQWKS